MKMMSVAGAAFAVAVASAPVHAQELRDVVGGIAQQYLQQEQDRAAYGQAQSQNTVAGYRAYLQQFPNGAYVSNARAQLRSLGVGTTDAERAQTQAETSAGSDLSGQQRREIQRRLTALGYDTSGSDGVFGPGTRRAIALWQRDRNYSQTGTLSSAQANELLRGQAPAAAGRTAAAETGPAQVEAGLRLSASQRGAVQAGLTQRGFDTRGVDGSFGPGTRNAIAGWQRANDLNPTGYLTADQVQRLTR